MDLKGHAEILSVFQREFCDPSGIPLQDMTKYLEIPPLNTVLRADRISCERQEDTIRNGLFEENRDRIILPDCLSLARIPELENIWIIRSEKDLGFTYTFANIQSLIDVCCTSGIFCTDATSQCETDRSSTAGEMLPEVVVDCAAGESCLRGAHIYAQGIMGCPSNLKKCDRVRIVSDVDGTCLKGRTYKFEGIRRYVGQGVLQYSRSDLFGANSFPSGIGIHVDKPCYPLLSLNEFLRADRHFFAQNLPSCVAVQVLDPQPEEVILDCCAAPGGKTLHIASLMLYRGRLVATDKSQQRAEELKKLCCDLDGFLEVYPADAANMLADAHCQNVAEIGPPPFAPGIFDRILVDAPCSGSGLRPRLSLKSLHMKQICSCPRNQKAILKGVVPLLKCGGILVYSTCSVLQRENEDVVAWVLKEFPALHLTSQIPHLGKCGFLVDGLGEEQSRLLQRFSVIPETDGLDTIGFFIAKFVKRC